MQPNETRKQRQGDVVRGLPVRPMHGRPGEGRPSGIVVVRLSTEASPAGQDNADTLAAHARAHQLRGLSRVIGGIGPHDSSRLVRSVSAEKVLDMEREAAHTKYRPLRSLTQYWRLDLRDRARDEIIRVIEMLSSLPEVDAVWEEPLSTVPAVAPGDDPYNAMQNYQDIAPMGIAGRWMWNQPDGAGAGIGIVDVEGGWRVTHEDLAAKAPTLIRGVQYANWEDHGTAVLGEIVAVDNTVGVVGTAPAITSVRMSSIYDGDGTQHVTDALVAAIAAMSVGQILLIELQTSYLPVETLDDCLDAIRLATARGIVVIEAAGNGGADLDLWTTAGGLHRLDRSSADFVDSGAIVVGASVSTVPHERWQYSNHGSRIDCFAWGENVVSCGYGDLDNGGGNADRWYTDSFQGTSSASPIIVSAAALVQSKYQAAAGTFLSPGQMRSLLAEPTTGTPQGTTVAGAIGVMPDLAKIAPKLGILPDVYLRDAVGDTGAVPWLGALSTSPDVIVRPTPVADPQLAYGEGSGTENSETLGYEVESGQENSIYVRVRNRGGAPAKKVVVTVYWSDVATLVTPSTWNLIGNVTIPVVPVGNILTVSPRLAWPNAGIPGVGHYCFVATLSHPNDPAPTPGPLAWSSFLDLIRAHNNVTWRNFNVVNDLPNTPGDHVAFAFKLAGADDRAHPFGFAIERRLPEDAVLELEGPSGLLVRLRGDNPWPLAQDKRSPQARLTLPALPRLMLEEVTIPRQARLPCMFRIRPGDGKVMYGHGITIRQLYAREEVGRIDWRFAPEARLCVEEQER